MQVTDKLYNFYCEFYLYCYFLVLFVVSEDYSLLVCTGMQSLNQSLEVSLVAVVFGWCKLECSVVSLSCGRVSV